jgi:class 3 adenylate cyclase/pimeloyl-ACP methyl ester carboxylesterase
VTSNAGLRRPETHFYTTSRGAVAYQVFGSGKPDIVLISHWVTNVDMFWDEPSAIRYFDRLGAMGRVILIDKLSSGVSDMAMDGPVPPVEEHMDDVRGVMAEIGSSSATLIGDTEGGMLAMMLAATYPHEFPRLVLINSYARLRRGDDYPIGAPEDTIARMQKDWREQHGTTADALELTAPSVADDQRFRAWFVRFQRAAQKPRAAAYAIEWIANTDVRAALPSIQSETLVIHRRDARFHRLAFGEHLAAAIPGARFEIVEGADTLPFHAGDFDPTLDLVEEFVTGRAQVHETNRVLATVLFTDIVGSTARASDMGDQRWLDLLTDHDHVVRRNLSRFRGNEVKMTGDGALATFDGPQRAILCALAIKRDLAEFGLPIRAGIHTGEIERRDGDLGGLAVHIASRVMEAAESGGVVVSGTVKDLVVGSPIEFDGCGEFSLKGVPGSWSLFEVRSPDG